MELFIKGKVAGIKALKNKAGEIEAYQLQFIEDTGNGLKLFQVKAPVEYARGVSVGKEITARVSTNIFNNNIYYKVIKPIKVS